MTRKTTIALFLVAALACLTYGIAGSTDTATAATHQARYDAAYYHAYSRANDYTGYSRPTLVSHYYYAAFSAFEFTWTTRYCGRKYMVVDINNDLSVRSKWTYGGHC